MFRHGFRVKIAALSLLSAMILTTACERRTSGTTNSAQPTTQTIAPAAAQPAPTGTDAMTQTVEVEDSRSEADGGVVTKARATTKPERRAPAPKKKGRK